MFFKELKTTLITSFNNLSAENIENFGKIAKTEKGDEHVSCRGKILAPDNMFDQLILLAHYYITPLFLDSLKVYHHYQKCFASVQSSQDDGWEFLKVYFSTWKNFMGIPTCGLWAKTRRVDWSNVQEAIHYLLT